MLGRQPSHRRHQLLRRNRFTYDVVVAEGADLDVQDGGVLRVWDSTNADWLDLRHNGTRAIIATNAGEIVLAPAAGLAWLHESGQTGQFRVYDSAGTDYISILHNGTDARVVSNAGHLRLDPATGLAFVFTSGTNGAFRVYAGTGTEYGYLQHDGTRAVLGSPAGDGNIRISADGAVAAEFDDTATSGDTRLLIYDVDNGQLERVTVGAINSGGTGFKVLRIPN